MKGKNRFGRLLHGGDYNPEQWLDHPEILKKDIALFKKARINEVSMGIFSWSALEPVEGIYTFDWMEQILDEMAENGISVMLATPSAAKPKWMTDRYPEVMRVSPMGVRDHFGGRHNHCYSSPVYREKVRKINTELAKRFGKHPAVIAWHISNELEGAPYPCYCSLCQQAFRDWLQKRYGSIRALNNAWATTFWSHTYQDFTQIEPPFANGENSIHGLNLDWKRFVTDRTADFLKMEIRTLREADSSLPVTINMMYNFDGLNYHKLAELVDFVSWDNYPQWHKREEYLTAMDSGMQHDIMRSMKKEPFFLMESCPSATNWQEVSKLKRPGMLHTASMQAIAHGSDSVQYFQLRQSRGSFEKFHGAVIDHYGEEDTRVFREVTQVGETLEALQEVTGSLVKSSVAVIYDFENRWALENAAGPRNLCLHYKDTVEKSYYAFRKQGLNVDVIDMSQSLEDYRIVAAPMVYLFREGFEEKVRAFTQAGGIFVMTYWSGIVNETDLCFLGGTPHGLMDVMGLRSTEIDALYDWDSNYARAADEESLLQSSYRISNLCDLVRVSTAEPLLVYGEDFYQGLPALTRNNFGKGKAYYICADLEQKFYDKFYGELTRLAGISGVMSDIPEGIEVTTRQSDDAEYLFVQNYKRTPVPICLPEGWELLHGEKTDKIESYRTIVMKKNLKKEKENWE